MPVNEQIRKAIVSNLTTDEIQKIAVDSGMQILRQSGIRKIIDGITTIEEVVSVSMQ